MSPIGKRHGVAAAIGAALGLTLAGASALLSRLTVSQQVDFLGSAFGALVAALTAFGVIEYQAHRERTRVRGVLLELVRSARTCLRGYVEAVEQKTTSPAAPENWLASLEGSIRAASAIASKHQAYGVGIAHAAHRLATLEPLAATLREGPGEDGLQPIPETDIALAQDMMEDLLQTYHEILTK